MRLCGIFQFHAPLDGWFDLAFFQQTEERAQVFFEPFGVLFTQIADGIERGLSTIGQDVSQRDFRKCHRNAAASAHGLIVETISD